MEKSRCGKRAAGAEQISHRPVQRGRSTNPTSPRESDRETRDAYPTGPASTPFLRYATSQIVPTFKLSPICMQLNHEWRESTPIESDPAEHVRAGSDFFTV